MLKGKLIGGVVVLGDEGMDVIDTEPPECPEGYKAVGSWTEQFGTILRTWELAPVEGTAQEAALLLCRSIAAELPDDQALAVTALYDEWIVGAAYSAGQRVRYHGALYKVLQGHVSQADWTPDVAPSLYAKVLPGQEGNEPEEGYAEWVQPDSTNGYSMGDRVSHNGKIWESTFDGANVWEPGAVGTEALWKDVTDEVSSDDQGGVEE